MMPVSWKRWTLSLVAVGAVAASVSGCVPLVLAVPRSIERSLEK